MVDRINHGLQWFRLVADLIQADGFNASERLAVVVDKGAALPAMGGLWFRKRHGYLQLKAGGAVLSGGWPAAGPRGSAFLPKVADHPAIP
jgi:hypothetical protein